MKHLEFSHKCILIEFIYFKMPQESSERRITKKKEQMGDIAALIKSVVCTVTLFFRKEHRVALCLVFAGKSRGARHQLMATDVCGTRHSKFQARDSTKYSRRDGYLATFFGVLHKLWRFLLDSFHSKNNNVELRAASRCDTFSVPVPLWRFPLLVFLCYWILISSSALRWINF